MSARLGRLLPERIARVTRIGWRRWLPRSVEARRVARRLFETTPLLAQDVHDDSILFSVFVDGQRFSVIDKYGNVEARQ